MIFLTALLVLSLQAESIMPDSLALPIPDGARIAEDCDNPLVEQLAPGTTIDPADGLCLALDMARYHEVMAALDTALEESGFDLSNRQGVLAGLYVRRDPPPGCRQALAVTPAPPTRGRTRTSTQPELRPFDGDGLLMFMPIGFEDCEN
ncbi:MAG: hypothetical protein ACXIVL_10250 [Oceanicaulis sp.]